jgi:hypothetical protein
MRPQTLGNEVLQLVLSPNVVVGMRPVGSYVIARAVSIAEFPSKVSIRVTAPRHDVVVEGVGFS